ncbi:MFS transporter [Sphaerimonospora cavernae]|uniref:MFS transporter n=1 Tax=Sphaerimonospora cavernae TaxID=1740611 RepID=A0ABV6UD77_9ACTN
MNKLNVLKESGFRWFFLAQCSSLLGDRMVAPALALAVLGLTGSAADLGWVLAAAAVPEVVFMLAGGVIGDRFPRQTVMLSSDIVRAVAQAATAFLLLTGRAQVWQLICLQVVHGTASALFTPAISGLVQATTHPGNRQAANALRGIAQSASMVGGPVLAGLLVSLSNPGWAVAIDSATFLLSAVFLSLVRLPPGDRRMRARPFLRDLLDGWRAFRSRRWVWAVIIAASLINMLYAAFIVLGPMVSRSSLGGNHAWAVLLTAFGLGSLIGGTVSLYVHARFPLRSGLVVVTLFAFPTLALATGMPLAVAAAGAFCGGIGLMVFNTLWETTLQRHVPAESLSRVSAYEWFGAMACQPIGLALVAPAAARFGLAPTLWAAGLAQVLISLLPLALRDVRLIPAEPLPGPEPEPVPQPGTV